MADIAAVPLRVAIDLPGRFDLDDELGDFGRSVVGPRGRNRKGQEEDYCLRRLLLAWAQVGLLSRPLRIVAPVSGAPDFTLAWSGVDRCGPARLHDELALEVTQATADEIQKNMAATANEFASLYPQQDGYVPAAHSHEIAKLVAGAIDKKVEKYRGKSRFGPAHLLVYENAYSDMGEVSTILGILTQDIALAERARAVFEQVHLIVADNVALDLLGQSRTVDLQANYAVDFFAWSKDQAQALRASKPVGIDVIHIAEEIDSMGKSERRSLRNQIKRLLAHLIKWQYQPHRKGASWETSIANARDEIEQILADSPSLQRQVEDIVSDLYPTAARTAAREMKIDSAKLPSVSPYTAEQILDPDFLPQ